MVNASPTASVPRRPSLADVARRAGVAVATASYALRAHPKIPAATRARVQTAADALGYRANAAVGRLMAELRVDRPKSDLTTLAWINCTPRRDIYTALPWLHGWLSGARRRADQLGYQLEEFWLGDPESLTARTKQILRTRMIPGLIMAPTRSTDGAIELDFSPFSVVTLARTFRRPALHRAAADDFANTVTAFDRLRALGYRRIGFFSSLLVCEWNDQRQIGAFLQRCLTVPPVRRLPPLVCHEEPPVGFARFRKWFHRWKPDALIAQGRTQLEWLLALGLDVPRDCGFAHLNLAADVPGWAGIDPQTEWIAASGVDLLVGLIHRHETGFPAVPKETLIAGRWIQGSTVRPQS